MRWTDDGIVVWPDAAVDAPPQIPLPTRSAPAGARWPDPPSGCAGRVYWRSESHAPAPEGFYEVVQAAGGGFGTGDHPTTRMCLERIDRLPAGAALDAGCGCGILAVAWAALGKGPVLATDPDPEAVRQTAASARLSGVVDAVTVSSRRLATLAENEVAGRVLLANLPLAGHREILDRLASPPPGALLSGLRAGEGRALVDAYRDLGLRVSGAARRRGWECWHLEPAA